MREIEEIIIHCSASTWGDAAEIDRWHKARGWKGIGYHFVVLNGKKAAGAPYSEAADGLIEKGRLVEEIGAHCMEHNEASIGICMIGTETFTWKQFVSLSNLVDKLMKDHNLSPDAVHGHHDFSTKSCPNFHVQGWIKEMLA